MGERVTFEYYMFWLFRMNAIKNGRRREREGLNLKHVIDYYICECQWVPLKTDRVDTNIFLRQGKLRIL